jgi:hypothetical protein
MLLTAVILCTLLKGRREEGEEGGRNGEEGEGREGERGRESAGGEEKREEGAGCESELVSVFKAAIERERNFCGAVRLLLARRRGGDGKERGKKGVFMYEDILDRVWNGWK